MARKPVDFIKEQRESNTPGMEALEHLYKALLAVPPFTLKDSTPVHIKGYQPPRINEAGEADCGVDVNCPMATSNSRCAIPAGESHSRMN
jgi:hypothetical protein